MSRCFPFPPPGYERKARAENLDLLTKEKHISKKDKKEKREREKKEGKERKHKDRSKEKHGEKKDWKEDKGRDKKDKEKKKDKNRSKDKASISNEKILERSGTNGGGKNGEHTQKAVESNDSKFTEELGRRIRDTEKGAGKNHVVENAAAKLQGSYDSAKLEKARGTDGQMANCIISSQKRPGDIPDQRILGSHISGNHLVTEPSRCVSHENDAYRKHESKKAIDPQQRVIPNHIISSAITTQKNGSGTSVLQEDAIKKLEGKEKTSDLQQRAIDNHTGSNTIAIVQSGTGVLQKKDGSKKTEDKEKTNNKKTGTQKGDKCKDRDREKRKDRKEKHKDKEKKKENDKMKEKGDHKDKGQKHVSDPVKEQNQLNTKPVLVFRDAEKHASFEGKPKRKEINGFLQESELRPNKLPRVAPSSNPPLENGKILDFNHIVMPCTSERHGAVTTSSHSDKLDGAVDNVKVERILDNKEQKVNGELHSQTPSTTLKPLVTNAGQIVDSTKKPPHPDSKYLSQILSVPEMDELPEFDDQDWLFRCDNMHQKPKMKLEADDMPQVWAKALKIESSDVLVLPYVIPY